jgi:ribosome-binding factor A
MTVSKARARKIGQRIQQEMARILLREANDPRFSLLTVTGVDVDRELAYATIHVNAAGAEVEQDAILRALWGARGFLRSQLAAEIELRIFPRLRFRWDDSPARGARIDDLLQQIKRDESGDDAR